MASNRRFNRELLTCGLSQCLNFFNFKVGATGAVGTLYQSKSNSIRSVTRTDVGDYTVQFNAPFPLSIAYATAQNLKADQDDLRADCAFLPVNTGASAYSKAVGQLFIECSDVDSAFAPVDPPNLSEMHCFIVEHRAPQMNV